MKKFKVTKKLFETYKIPEHMKTTQESVFFEILEKIEEKNIEHAKNQCTKGLAHLIKVSLEMVEALKEAREEELDEKRLERLEEEIKHLYCLGIQSNGFAHKILNNIDQKDIETQYNEFINETR